MPVIAVPRRIPRPSEPATVLAFGLATAARRADALAALPAGLVSGMADGCAPADVAAAGACLAAPGAAGCVAMVGCVSADVTAAGLLDSVAGVDDCAAAWP